jgi:hypothetical protein
MDGGEERVVEAAYTAAGMYSGGSTIHIQYSGRQYM